MDCCGTSKPEETEKAGKAGKPINDNDPMKGHTHGGGCGGGAGMWMHLLVMFAVFIAIWYFTKG